MSHLNEVPDNNELKLQIKELLKDNPYFRTKKGAAHLKVSEREYQHAYEELIESGEVTYTDDHPAWKDPKNKAPIRKHSVK